MTQAPTSIATNHVFRVEVRPAPGEPDALAHPHTEAVHNQFGSQAVLQATQIFLIEAPLAEQTLLRIAGELLADPVGQQFSIGTADIEPDAKTIEVHYKTGVMDPVALSARAAIGEMLSEGESLDLAKIQVRTAVRYDIRHTEADAATLEQFARQTLANTVIQEIYTEPYHPAEFATGSPYTLHLTHVPIRNLDDAALQRLSREGHLFLSLEEMQAIQTYYQDLQREPTDVELETLAQTWSEHCVHKTLKATIHYTPLPNDAIDFTTRPGHDINDDGSITIHNLLKSTIAAATKKLMNECGLDQWCVSVFVDNAGIVRFDDQDGITLKVETHNHPSAIEPYGGAATGIGGCIRDTMGTGLAGKPIANTNVFCVAHPDQNAQTLPNGVIHPKRVLQQVVGGVRDYGNRMGIPTVNGAVWFDDNYLGNPLVFAGSVGIIPLDKCFGDAQPGDRIIALGGRTGRDGIHGATFSSAELTDSHADEFSHAVQIGNAITEKKTLDVILKARDAAQGCLFSAITDCGAGGFSSAVGEMGEKVGAKVTLDTAPLKYQGLSYTHIWISEAQERMVLSVPPQNVAAIQALCDAEDVELSDLGEFGITDDQQKPQLILTYQNTEVGKLAMELLHDGIPMPTRKAISTTPGKSPRKLASGNTASNLNASNTPLDQQLKTLLSHPNIASKHWIIRQYDHEVQGGSVVKPLTGPNQDGPSDAAVLRPKLDSDKGIALGCGLQTGMEHDAYWMTLAAIDEAVRNVICVGADPSRIAILDNFCWPGCDDPKNLGSLVRAAEACYDGALAYKTPFVSGKDSLNNQFTTDDGQRIEIPPTLLITAMGIVEDAKLARTMDAKASGNLLLVIGNTTSAMGGSHYLMTHNDAACDPSLPQTDLQDGPANAAFVAGLIHHSLITSAHDCSDGGLLVAAAEMAFAGNLGLDLAPATAPTLGNDNAGLSDTALCFSETPSRYLVEVHPDQLDTVIRLLKDKQIPFGEVGRFTDQHQRLTVRSAQAGQILDVALDDLKATWKKPLDW